MSDIYRSAKYDQEMNRLRARIAELKASANTSICIFCGTTMEKDWAVILDHAKGCELRPENRLMLQIAELEAERDAKASAYTNTLKCLGRQAETISKMETELARLQSCLAQGKGLARVEDERL